MDPLSIAASVIAIASLASKVTTAISSLRSISKSLPGRLHAVHNEVADLELVLFQLAELIKERACLPDSKDSAVPHLLKQARLKLNEIHDIVHRLTAAYLANRNPFVGANAWRKEQTKLQILQEDIRTVKCSLNIMVGASNSQDMLRIRLDVQAISTATTQSSENQLALSEKFLTTLAGVDERIVPVQNLLQSQAEQLHASQLMQVGSLYQAPRPVAKRPLLQGRASPRDVSTTRGYSLLRWALYAKQYDACVFLIRAGADPSYRPIAASDNSPRKKACHFLLEGGCSEKAVEALRAITRGSEYLDDFIEDSKFTQTHKIVLGLSLKNLEEELILHPEDIDIQDSMGRTPLAWAAARGDSRTVVILLKYGADPNIMDVQLSGPVSNAAAQGHTACVLLLLDAGADPEPALPPGIQKGSPLSVACRNAKDPLLAKRLLDFGANVNSCTSDGRTPLFHAAKNNDTRLAILLLEYGADINHISVAGETPLTMSIIHNSHSVLRLLLERWHEYSVCPRLKGPHLLEIAASYADFETLQILADTDHFRHKHDKQFTVGDFRSRLVQRPDISDKLSLAFDELLSIINAAPCPLESEPSLLEAAFFSCLPSRSNTFDQNYERPCPVDEMSNDSDDSFYDALP